MKPNKSRGNAIRTLSINWQKIWNKFAYEGYAPSSGDKWLMRMIEDEIKIALAGRRKNA